MGHPVDIRVEPALLDRDRLTTLFRLILALPHLLLVGGPIGVTLWATYDDQRHGPRTEWPGSCGVLGAVAWVAAVISWFAILFTGRQPAGLRDLVLFYLRWQVRAAAYVALLRDEYPPFGDAPYPATLDAAVTDAPRDRLSVALRLVYALPHLVILWGLGIAWAITTFIAWFAILLGGSCPAGLHSFGIGVLRWNVRVEAYLLLVHDEYPPFSLA